MSPERKRPNSAVVGANLIPLLALGIPGNVTAALLVGAFIIHGFAPGPWMFEDHGRLIYGMFAAMVIANVLNLAIGTFGLPLFAKVLAIPKAIILPALVFLGLTGSFLNDQSFFAVGLTVAFAVLGYLMRKLGYPFVPFIIGFVLTPMLELSFSQAHFDGGQLCQLGRVPGRAGLFGIDYRGDCSRDCPRARLALLARSGLACAKSEAPPDSEQFL